MSDVFISYKREDRSKVEPIADGLRRADLTVWMDVQTPGGTAWRQAIVSELEEARCVVVVWSEASVGPAGEFVHEEATRAKERGVLLPVRIDDATAPIGFGEVQSLDLVGWRGKVTDPRFQDLVAAARAMVAGEARPRPTAAAKGKRVAVTAAVAMLATVVAFAGDIAGFQRPACRLPGVHGICRIAGLGGVPTSAEENLWLSRAPRECAPLRVYLERYPSGAFAQEAERRLLAAETETRERWEAAPRRLPLGVRQQFEPLADEAAAREEALVRGADEATRLCNVFSDTDEFRLDSAGLDAQIWRCVPRAGGVVCGFDGEAVCELEARHLDSIEVCS